MRALTEPEIAERTERRRQKADVACKHISEGKKVNRACQLAGFTWRELWEWKADDPVIAAWYVRARAANGEVWEERSTEHARKATPETVGVARLREENARWRANMANRKQYGHSVDVTSQGESIRPAVVMLPPMDAMPVPLGSIALEHTVTTTRRIVAGAEAAEKLRLAMARGLNGGLAVVEQSQNDQQGDAVLGVVPIS